MTSGLELWHGHKCAENYFRCATFFSYSQSVALSDLLAAVYNQPNRTVVLNFTSQSSTAELEHLSWNAQLVNLAFILMLDGMLETGSASGAA